MPCMMLSLGDFKFSVNTASYESLKQVSTYGWSEQSRIHNTPCYHASGKASETIDLDGVIYPHYKGGFGQIKSMREVSVQAP